MARKRGNEGSVFGDIGLDLHKKLTALEAILGSQKKAAERLGVSPSTYRKYKSGKAAPDKAHSKKINYVYGQNKKKLADPKIEKKIESREKAAEKKRAAAEVTNRKRAIVTESTRTWLKKEYGDGEHEYMRDLDRVATFVAYDRNNPEFVQFTDDVSFIGKPKGQTRVKIWALYAFQYKSGEQWVDTSNDDESKLFMLESTVLIPIEADKEWDLQRTIDYINSHLHDEKKSGRTRYAPQKLIGYRL